MARRKLEVEILGDSKSLERAFGRSTASARGFSTSMTGAALNVRRATTAMAGAIGVLVGGAGVAVNQFSKFEDSMQRIVGLSGVAQERVRRFNGEVLKLAPAVGKSPQELAEALFFITSSGIKASQAMGVLTASAKASAAGLGDTQVVADAVTSAMNAYGPAVVSARKATNVLVATVREGKGEAADFAGVIGNVAAIAAQLGVSFEDVGAALAAQTRLGTDAETSAIQLQAVFSQLVKVAPQAEKAFASVGLSSAGLRRELKEKGLLATLTTLKRAFGDNTVAMAAAFPNIRALRGVLSLVGKQADATAGVFNRMSDNADALKIAFGAVSKDTAQQFRKMKAAAQVAAISIGAALAPLASVVARGVTAASTKLTDFVGKLSDAHTFSAKIEVVSDTAQNIGRELSTKLSESVNAVDWNAAILTARAGLLNALRKLGEVVGEINWGQVGRSLGKFLSGAFSQTATFLNSVDWGVVGRSIVRGITDFLKGVDYKAIAIGVVKLLAAALKAEVTLLVGVGTELGKTLMHAIGVGLDAAKDAVLHKLLQFVNKVLGVTGFLGRFDPFKGVRAKVQKQLDAMEADVANSARAMQSSLDGIKGRTITIDIKTVVNAGAGSPRRPEEGTQARDIEASNAKATEAAAKAAKAAADARSAAADALARAHILAAAKIKKAAAAAKIAKQKAQEAFDALMDAFSLKVDRAAVTRGFGDDLKALNQELAAITAREKVEGKTVALERARFQTLQTLADVRKQQADAAKKARDASQFKTLGLTATGDTPVPGVKALKKQLGSIDKAVEGTFLDTGKTRSLLQRIKKVLGAGLTGVSAEVRSKIAEMLSGLDNQLKDHEGGQRTKAKLIDVSKALGGLNLNGDQLREATSRLAGATLPGGGRRAAMTAVPEVHVFSDIYLNNEIMARAVSKSQNRRDQRNATPRRGRPG